MSSKTRCAICLAFACVCFAGSALASNRDAIKQVNDFMKNAARVVAATSSTSLSTTDHTFFYVSNAMGGPDLKIVRDNKPRAVDISVVIPEPDEGK